MSKRQKDSEMKPLGAMIRTRREAVSMSQSELACRSKIHRNYINGIERAERNITIISLIRLANGLEIKPSELLEEAEL